LDQLRYFIDPNVQTLWDKKLAVDFKDGKVAAETYLGAPSQRWSISIRPGYITSLANTSLVIDDHYCSTQSDNPVWAFPYNGTAAQQSSPVPAFQAIAARKPQSQYT
jgi:hypothetical protein